jgi:hypothetical protein
MITNMIFLVFVGKILLNKFQRDFVDTMNKSSCSTKFPRVFQKGRSTAEDRYGRGKFDQTRTCQVTSPIIGEQQEFVL